MKSGVINLRKASHESSARAIGGLKRIFPRKTKIGHAGTLDPFATGVLVVLIGKATKISEKMMSLPKQYIATIKLGANTITDDPESQELINAVQQIPELSVVSCAVNVQVGTIMQKPPAYSALKVAGMRACDRVRMGETIDLPARLVQIYGIEIMHYEWPLLKIKVDCGRGTYIRSIARDIGAILGTGGYVTELCRTRVGDFLLENSIENRDLSAENVDRHLIPIPPDFLTSRSSQPQPQPDLLP